MKESYIFLNTNWYDTFILDKTTMTFIRRSNYETGKFKTNNDYNEIIINNLDIFIKYWNNYYEKDFFYKYIKEQNLCVIEVIDIDKISYNYVINRSTNIIFRKDDISIIGKFHLNNNFLNIIFNNNSILNLIKLKNKYYHDSYLDKVLDFIDIDEKNFNNLINDNEKNDNDTVNKDNDKKYNQIENSDINNNELDHINNNELDDINNNESFDKRLNILHDILKKNINTTIIENFKNFDNKYYFNFKITNLISLNKYYTKYNLLDNIDINIIDTKLKELLLNNKNNFKNKKYLCLDNIENYLNNENKNIDESINNIINYNIKINIPVKQGKRALTLAEWGYPAFGGGENWLLTFNQILHNNGYETYFICFSDPFKNEYFNKINLIDLGYVKIIQMPKHILEIIQIIKIIDPDFIHHQGINRISFMKLSNILEIPFLTGFCFWNDIIKFNLPNININMLSNERLEKTDIFESIIKNSYCYVSSEFVNDIIYKLYNIKLDVIETISSKEDFYIENNFANDDEYNKKIYVTIINCHYHKGGFLIKYLCETLNFNIPLQLVYTENDPNISIDYVRELIKKRNLVKDINILISEKVNIKIIYNKTRILLTPSICEETFCRVAYEGMMNKIPIISTSNGNLKYLLNEYAIFINELNIHEWKTTIENIYNDHDLISKFYKRTNNYITIETIQFKILNKIKNINKSKYKLSNNNIGIIIPWGDQGLGIQGRDYYITLKELGYTPYVLSFKPYHSSTDNPKLQSDEEEWNYSNITYSSNYRENLTYDEIIDFIYKNNIKKIIIIEASYIDIFNTSYFLKLLNVELYLVINIECTRLNELVYHNIFNKLLTNNIDSYKIVSSIFNDKCDYLGFHLNHPYFKNCKEQKTIKKNIKKLKFCCIGGLNSISRKNIDKVVKTFYKISEENKYKNWELNIYIQGVEIPEIFNEYKSDKINYYVSHLSYKLIIDKYIKNDIFIHLGSHEGLGLGFYESLYCGTPIITIDWCPNNEIVINNINGWIIDCNNDKVYDNNISMINRGIVNDIDLENKIIQILTNDSSTLKIINNTIENIEFLKKKNKSNFEKKLMHILSST